MTHTSTTWRVLAVAALVILTAGAFNAPGRIGASTASASSTGPIAASHRSSGPAAAAAVTGRARAAAALPSGFEINAGQTDRRVTFLAHGSGYTLFLTATEAVLNVAARRAHTAGAGKAPASPAGGDVVRLRLAGANAHARVAGLDQLPGASNYLLGHNRRSWRTDVRSYARVAYTGIYRGINLVYHGARRQLEYDFVLAPGVSPKAIKLDVLGARGLRLDRAGNLILRLPNGDLSQARPVVYEQVRGRRVAVSGRYALLGRGRVGFAVGRHNTRAPLVIDPVLSYSTYLGGSADGSDSAGNAVAVDPAGNAYVTGFTGSTTFPTTTGAYSTTAAGAADAFVTKLNPTGAILYSTYLGGNDNSAGAGVAVDNGGSAYVTGSTSSTDFPTTTGAYSTTAAGSSDAFVTKLSANGRALAYSTVLGGADVDSGAAIALAGPNRVYVTGSTSSADFPTTGSYRVANNGGSAVFAASLNTAASGAASLVYSTLLGGSGFDTGSGIAVDGAGAAYVTGSTNSTNFPTTAGAYATANKGGTDAFVTGLNATGTISYSSYLGGSGDDHGQAIALDGSGAAYVTGYTQSGDFPLTNPLSPGGSSAGCAGLNRSGSSDAFVAKLNAGGSALVYSTYLGGSGADAGYGIAVDGSRDAYVTGSTSSTDFPTTTDAYTATNSGGSDAFVTKLNAAGNGLLYSTYLGGASDDTGYGIAAGATNDLYVTGQTYSTNFPTAGAADASNSGSSSAFVSKISGTMGEPGGSASMSTSTPVPACTPVPGTATPPPATATPAPATPAPASEKGRYTFDDQTANDSSGNGHNGTLQGAAAITAGGAPTAGGGNDPYALSVNGSGAFVDIPGPLVNTAQSFSVAAWVNLTNTNGYQTFASVDGANAAGDGSISGFFLQLRGDNHKFAIAQIDSDAPGPATHADSTIVPSANTWYQVTGVYDGAAHQLRLYVNGQLQGTAAYNGGFTATGDTIIGRGKYNGSPGDYATGKLDEVHFYQGVLTDAQIAGLAGVTPANTATATATTMATSTPTATSTTAPVSTPATPGTTTGALQGSQDAAPISPTSVNLTTEGTADWIEWGDKDKASTAPDYSGDYNRKAGVAPQITTFNPVGYGTESLSGGGGTVLTWSDGTPASSGTNNGQGVYVSGNGNFPPSSGGGFQFKIPADTTTRELRIYVNVNKARGRLTASVGDNSAPIYSDDSLGSTGGTAAGVYTLYYRAASAGQTLTVDWETAVDYGGGGVVLEAATLRQVTTIPPTGTATPIPPTATPVPLTLNAYYKFDEGSGTTANDSSGANHTGTLIGDAGYTAPGQPTNNDPYALTLNNTANNGFVDVPEPVINTAESYSVAAWVNLNNTSGFHTAVSIDGQRVSAFFLQYCDQCHTFAFAAPGSDTDGPSSTRAQATIGLPNVGQWYYLTGVYDAANQVIKLYVDGVLQDTQPYFAANAFTMNGHTVIGRGKFNGNPVDFFPGKIDDVCLYQGILSDAQIAQKTCVTPAAATATATGTTVAGTATGTTVAGTATGTTVAGTATGTTVAGTATGTATGTTVAGTSTATGTATGTPVPPTATNTPVPPTATNTAAPATATNTAVPPTATNTVALPSATSTSTPVPATATGTAVPPTSTRTAVPPTATSTAVPPTATSTRTAVLPTATSTRTAAPPTATSTPTAQPVCQLFALPVFDTVPRGGNQAFLVAAAPGSAITLTVRAPYPANYPASATLYTDSSLAGDGFGRVLAGTRVSGGYRYTFRVEASGLALLTFEIPRDARPGTVVTQVTAQEPCGQLKTVATFQVRGKEREKEAARARGSAVTLSIPLRRGDALPASANKLMWRGVLRVATHGRGSGAQRVLLLTYHPRSRPARAGATGAAHPRPRTLFGVAVGTGTQGASSS